MNYFHKKIKMSHAYSETKNNNVMTILCGMQNLYTSNTVAGKLYEWYSDFF